MRSLGFQVRGLGDLGPFLGLVANHASSSFGVEPQALMPSALVRSANAGDVTTARTSAEIFSSIAAGVAGRRDHGVERHHV